MRYRPTTAAIESKTPRRTLPFLAGGSCGPAGSGAFSTGSSSCTSGTGSESTKHLTLIYSIAVAPLASCSFGGGVRQPTDRGGRFTTAETKLPSKTRGRQNCQDRNKLRGGQQLIKHKPAVLISAQELDEKTRQRVKTDVNDEDFAVIGFPADAPQDDRENPERGQGLVNLRRVNRYVQGHACDLVAQGVSKHHAQERRGGLAVIAAGGETAEPPHALPESEGGRDDVPGLPKWQPVRADVPRAKNRRGDKAAIKNAARLERRPTENLAGIVAVETPFGKNHEHFRAEQTDHDQPGAQ